MESQFVRQVLMYGAVLALCCLPEINGQEKNAESLRRLPRFGRTEAELELLWGKPVGKATIYCGKMHKGVKKQHIEYFGKRWSGYNYRVDDVLLSVGFYDGKSIAITFRSVEGKLPFAKAEKVAKGLTRVSFSSRPVDTSGDFCMYSSDLKQRYMFRKTGGYAVVDMELVADQLKNPKVDASVKNL